MEFIFIFKGAEHELIGDSSIDNNFPLNMQKVVVGSECPGRHKIYSEGGYLIAEKQLVHYNINTIIHAGS